MIEWFDDLALGMRFKTGEVSVTKEEIKRFAAEFDPQPFHLDESAAQKTILKGLAASGWHTAAISMSLIVKIRPFGPQPLMGLGRGRVDRHLSLDCCCHWRLCRRSPSSAYKAWRSAF
jgi:acyl dehydratase